MSREEQREDSILLKEVAQQLNLYDNLFPEVQNKELQVLFALIRIYLARCDNPGLRQEHIMISHQLMKRLSVTYFDPFTSPASHSLKEPLVSRLNSLRKYRITNPEVVRRTLVACIYQQKEKTYTKPKMYLNAFMKNPGRSFTDIAKKIGVTPQAVSQACRALRKSDLLYFYGYINYPFFKLRHIFAFFSLMREYRQKTDYLRRLFLEDLPFTMSLNLDVYEGSSWASFAIPNQPKEIREFKEGLNAVEGEVLRDIRLSEISSSSTNSNLEFFDGKQWFFDPELWAYGFFEFVRENKDVLTRAPEFRYATQPTRFDKIDFLIAAILATNSLMSQYEIMRVLRQYGYSLSRPTVTRKIRRLVSPSHDPRKGVAGDNQPAIFPYTTYWGLGLSNLSAYLIECSQDQVEELYYAVSYLPYYFLYRTDNGVLLFIKSSTGDAAKINYMIKGIDGIRVLTHSNRFENVGVRSLTHLHEFWDETKQRWVCASSQLNLATRYETLQ